MGKIRYPVFRSGFTYENVIKNLVNQINRVLSGQSNTPEPIPTVSSPIGQLILETNALNQGTFQNPNASNLRVPSEQWKREASSTWPVIVGAGTAYPTTFSSEVPYLAVDTRIPSNAQGLVFESRVNNVAIQRVFVPLNIANVLRTGSPPLKADYLEVEISMGVSPNQGPSQPYGGGYQHSVIVRLSPAVSNSTLTVWGNGTFFKPNSVIRIYAWVV